MKLIILLSVLLTLVLSQDMSFDIDGCTSPEFSRQCRAVLCDNGNNKVILQVAGTYLLVSDQTASDTNSTTYQGVALFGLEEAKIDDTIPTTGTGTFTVVRGSTTTVTCTIELSNSLSVLSTLKFNLTEASRSVNAADECLTGPPSAGDYNSAWRVTLDSFPDPFNFYTCDRLPNVNRFYGTSYTSFFVDTGVPFLDFTADVFSEIEAILVEIDGVYWFRGYSNIFQAKSSKLTSCGTPESIGLDAAAKNQALFGRLSSNGTVIGFSFAKNPRNTAEIIAGRFEWGGQFGTEIPKEKIDCSASPENRRVCGYTAPVCPAPFTGPICDDCQAGFALPNCTSCLPRYQQPDCSACMPQYAGANCANCSMRYTGANCDSCAPGFSGTNCANCSMRWAGANCDSCSLRFDGTDCSNCSKAFAGTNCENCATGYTGTDCAECTAGYWGNDCTACSCGADETCKDTKAGDGTCLKKSSSITSVVSLILLIAVLMI